MVEADKSPYAAAVREVQEELDLMVRPGRLLVTDCVPPRPDRTEGLMVVFDGGILTPERAARIHLPAEELHSWAWCTPQEAGEQLSELAGPAYHRRCPGPYGEHRGLPGG